MSKYLFGHSNEELLRLQLQAELFEPETTRTLILAGIKSGMKCVDFGCGNGYTSILLSKLVGEEGRVVALDSSKDALIAAEENAKRKNIKNIEFVLADAYNTNLKDEHYDLAFSRFLFTHLAEPEKAVREMVRIVKPKGVVVAEDFNHELRITYPYNEHIERLRMYFIQLLKKNGSRHEIGGMLYSIFKNVGLQSYVNLYSICCPMDGKYKTIPLLFANVLKDKFLGYDIILDKEYEEIINGIKTFIENKDSLLLYSSIFRVWGFKILSRY